MNGREGSKADIAPCGTHVRYYPQSGRLLRCHEMTLCAITDQSAVQQNTVLFDHLIGTGQQLR